MVSGTNGKTTTTHFLAAAVRASLGPDARSGWCTTPTAPTCTTASPRRSASSPTADIAILETDERVVADMVRLGRPEVLVLLNFSRDQLDRHHEIKGLGRSWRNALAAAGEDGPVVVANADEPLIVWAAQTAREVVWVDTASDLDPGRVAVPAAAASALVREQPDHTGGPGGDWHCTGCDLAQPPASYRVRGRHDHRTRRPGLGPAAQRARRLQRQQRRLRAGRRRAAGRRRRPRRSPGCAR